MYLYTSRSITTAAKKIMKKQIPSQIEKHLKCAYNTLVVNTLQLTLTLEEDFLLKLYILLLSFPLILTSVILLFCKDTSFQLKQEFFYSIFFCIFQLFNQLVLVQTNSRKLLSVSCLILQITLWISNDIKERKEKKNKHLI